VLIQLVHFKIHLLIATCSTYNLTLDNKINDLIKVVEWYNDKRLMTVKINLTTMLYLTCLTNKHYIDNVQLIRLEHMSAFWICHILL
jgi:hypothetical protein